MALINCPECNKEISNKSKICIYCGYPISEEIQETNPQLYKVQFKKFRSHGLYSKNSLTAYVFVYNIYGTDEPQAKHINLDREYMIFDGISKKSAELVKEFLEMKGCIIEILDSDLTELSEVDSKILSAYQKSVIKCPNCNSINTERISTTSKIIGATTFGLLSKTAKSQFKCNHCSYKW